MNRGRFAGKVDWKSAYRQIGVHRDCQHLLGKFWRGLYSLICGYRSAWPHREEAFTRGSEQPGAATPFVWRTVSASELSPRDPQSRGACRGATSLRTRNAAVLPAAQRYGVSARGPVPGGEGKYDRRVLTQQQRQGLLASENGSCFCWKPHYSHRSVEGYRCCFL